MAEAADRARLAKKLADAERHAARDRAGRDWARRAADAADLVLDDDAAVGEAGFAAGPRRDARGGGRVAAAGQHAAAS